VYAPLFIVSLRSQCVLSEAIVVSVCLRVQCCQCVSRVCSAFYCVTPHLSINIYFISFILEYMRIYIYTFFFMY